MNGKARSAEQEKYMEISFYTAGEDLATLKTLLSSLDSFARLVSLGNDQFVAQRDLYNLGEGHHQLWIIATESLKVKTLSGDFVEVDPFVPWVGSSIWGDCNQPMIAALTSSRIVQLHIRHNESALFDLQKVSSTSSTGNHYASIGAPAPASALEAWKKLRKAIQKSTVRLPVRTSEKLTTRPGLFFPRAAAQFQASHSAVDAAGKG
jgi:hypothetical protein